MDKTLIAWLLTLGIGFPLLSVALEELAAQLKRQKHPLAHAIRKIKQYVLPPLAVLLVMRELLKIAKTENSARLVESITWVAVIFVGTSLINAILTTKKPEKQFQIQVPNLFFQVARALVVLGIGYYLITGIWAIDLSELTTALGVGSLVIALALQDTLSNLVSGLLLLIAKPFKIGDYIEVNGVQAYVVDQNWWSVTLDANGFFLQSVPNSTLATASITNYGQGATWKSVAIGFSYDDPPNQVIPALNSLVDGIAGVTEGSGFAAINSYGDSSINYDLWYLVIPREAWGAGAKILTRIYYMAQREGFTIPYPIHTAYEINTNEGIPSKIPQIVENRQSEKIKFLRSLSYFFNLSDAQIEQLASKSQFKVYGAGESITQEGKPDAGLYAVYEGRVKSLVTDVRGIIQADRQFGIGDVFGEMALYPGEVSPIKTIAEDDVELVIIPAEVIVNLIQINPKFASEIIQFIEERKKAISVIKTITDVSSEFGVRSSEARS